jgi:hypothetical protein
MHYAARRCYFTSSVKLLDSPVSSRLLAGGAGGHPAPEGRKLEGLGKVPEGESFLSKLGFDGRTTNSCLEGGKHALGVE